MKKITIFTPTYNRSNTLPKLYASLQAQDCKEFVWYVVDDGSKDNTIEYMSSIVAAESSFEVRFDTKPNGGKHTAINYALDRCYTELFFIVDSDDILTPDAISTILKDWDKYRSSELCGIGYLRGYINTDTHIGDKYPFTYKIGNYIEVYSNQGVSGDKAEVWVTQYMKQYKFPEYQGEHFCSEGLMWVQLAMHSDMLMVNKIIYKTEYLPGGLSETGRPLRLKCPKGMIDNSLMQMSTHFTLKYRFKEAMLYIFYSKFDNRNIIRILNCKYMWLVAVALVPGLSLYHYWKYKFRKYL